MSGALISPKGNWKVKDVIDDFKEDTEEFLKTYFGEIVKPMKRIIDYNKMRAKLLSKLRRIRKGLPPPR